MLVSCLLNSLKSRILCSVIYGVTKKLQNIQTKTESPQTPYYQALRSDKDNYLIFKKAIQQNALILRFVLQKAYNSGLFALSEN